MGLLNPHNVDVITVFRDNSEEPIQVQAQVVRAEASTTHAKE